MGRPPVNASAPAASTTAKPVGTQRRFGPDLIRAGAIVLVLLSHTLPGGHTFPILQVLKEGAGYLGVEVFFVLSGYLIGGLLMQDLQAGRLDSPAGLVAFWKRRWFRTLPNYYLFLVLFLLLTRLQTGHFPAGGFRYWGFSQALLSAHPDFFPAAWSLAVEEWFYLLFPLLLMVCARLTPDRERALMAPIGILLLGPLLLRCLLPPDAAWDAGVRKVTLPRLDVLMYGVGLAFLERHRQQIWKRLVQAWPLGLTMVAGLIGYWGVGQAHFGEFNAGSLFHRGFFFCFTSLGLFLAFPKWIEWNAPQNRLAPVIRHLSLWSYSIYLSHTFFGGILLAIYARHGWSIYKLNAVIISTLVWISSLTASALVYRFYEKPLMDLRDQPLKSVVRRFLAPFRGLTARPP